MKRLCAILGVTLFVVGVLVVHAVHGLALDHCDSADQSESHNPETCAICTVAATALVVPCVHIDVSLLDQEINHIYLPDPLLSVLFIPDSHLARAPPLSA
jgi:hypothetical protein